MSTHPRKRRNQHRYGHARRFTVRGVRRDPADMGKLSRALLGLAMAEAERQAQADHTARASDIDTPEAASQPQPESEGGAHA